MRCQRTHIFFTFHFTKAILRNGTPRFSRPAPQQNALFKDACLGKQRVEAGNIGAAVLSSLGGIPIGYASLLFRASARFKGGQFSSMYSGARRPATGSMAPLPRPANAAPERMEPKTTDVFPCHRPFVLRFPSPGACKGAALHASLPIQSRR